MYHHLVCILRDYTNEDNWNHFHDYIAAYLSLLARETKMQYRVKIWDSYLIFNTAIQDRWEEIRIDWQPITPTLSHPSAIVCVDSTHNPDDLGCRIVLVIAAIFFNGIILTTSDFQIFDEALVWLFTHDHVSYPMHSFKCNISDFTVLQKKSVMSAETLFQTILEKKY